MKRMLPIVLLLTLVAGVGAQEVLLPVRHGVPARAKGDDVYLTLPFFDDFSDRDRSESLWEPGGTFFNQGYAPLPPTVGMATLDAFDAEGELYPKMVGQLFTADTLLSKRIRLDSVFTPYRRAISTSDSVYLSFFYLPGGGYGNMWQRIGDTPEEQDSLVLEFYDPTNQNWERIWTTEGVEADTLKEETGSYWQFMIIPITEERFLNKDFRFRFRNYCTLSNINKNGILSNADQWNIDYVYINVSRNWNDKAARDVAFVNPAPTLLKHYQAMPIRQYTPEEMADSVNVLITNLFTEELATNYGYKILDEQGRTLYTYDGGFENAPVYWTAQSYQTASAHAHPPVEYSFPMTSEPRQYTIVHGVREGVSGDIHTQNDTIAFQQTFDNYYAYDDGNPENGYGITSTSSRIKLAYRFRLNVEDTLTALDMYFNRTLGGQNGNIRFLITVWDDADGEPGNIIYQDIERRHPMFEGFNTYVRYKLEQPVVCNGTIYVGLEQQSSDYLNLGFDRNTDASSNIFYLTSAHWQTSILEGSLMMRPYFGHKATVGIAHAEKPQEAKVWADGGRIHIEAEDCRGVEVYNAMGQKVYASVGTEGLRCSIVTTPLPRGVYWVRIGQSGARKVFVY